MGKKKIQYDGGHYSRGQYKKEQLTHTPPGKCSCARLCSASINLNCMLRQCAMITPGPGEYGGLDRHALYESAVQSPKGDISYLLCFYRKYIGLQVIKLYTMHLINSCSFSGAVLPVQILPMTGRRVMQVPVHLREDFCGTALISATWCRGDVRRSAVGSASLHFCWLHTS